ncbi:MAG: divL 2 [Nocardioides sp.]|jgi:PAS domain S-box-containing protein|uniref:PAS domain S-box protein n=1 Tax=Nocardioides sp. TaxID=35761 RepID=UPI0026230E7E|nr:PAS domain S-box protein [Nocardioides sp.]MCW2834558.1 divL 2 [Nocardioides sp.]
MTSRAQEILWDKHAIDMAAHLMHDAVVVYGEDGRIVAVNQLLLAATGYARDELIDRHALTLMPEDLRDELAPRMVAYLNNPAPRGFGQGLDLAIRRKDGTTYDADAANTPVRGPDGLLVMVAIRDVKDLSLDEIRFRSLLESAPEATLILNSEGRIILSNVHAEQLFGLDRIQMFDQTLDLLFPSPHAQLLLDGVRACHCAGLAGRTIHPAFEVKAVRASREVLPVEVQVAPLSTTQGLLLCVSVRDVSERERLQSEADRIKDGFLATVSHELRTPLTSILGYAELLEDLGPTQLGDRARKFVHIITRSARRELRLVDDLLTLAWIANGTLGVNPHLLDLKSVVQDVVENNEPAALDAAVLITVLYDDTDVYVHGDRDRLSQAIDNLLTNALKFAPPASEVRIKLGSDADMAALSISDNGPGIPDADIAHVFDRLYRGEHAVNAEKPGAGLGLPIVKAIVDAHHGKVNLTATPGVGTCLEIRLPLVPRDHTKD